LAATTAAAATAIVFAVAVAALLLPLLHCHHTSAILFATIFLIFDCLLLFAFASKVCIGRCRRLRRCRVCRAVNPPAETGNCKGHIVPNPDEVDFIVVVVLIVVLAGTVLQYSTPPPIVITAVDCYFVPVISTIVFLDVVVHQTNSSPPSLSCHLPHQL
jgi:hypothetical protein